MYYYNALQQNIKNGTLFSFSKKEIVEVYDEFPCGEFIELVFTKYKDQVFFSDCFDVYWRRSTDAEFYFAFPLLPQWFDKVVKDFNTKFDNINIKIIKEKDVTVLKKTDDESDYTEVTLKSALFTIEFNKKYSYDAVEFLRYFIHHFLKMMSLTENYIPERYIDAAPKFGFVKSVLAINSWNCKGNSYKSLSEYPIRLGEFLLMDKIHLMNKRFKNRSRSDDNSFRQTEISLTISNRWLHNFRNGDLVYTRWNKEIFEITDARRDGSCLRVKSMKPSNPYVTFFSAKELKKVKRRDFINLLY